MAAPQINYAPAIDSKALPGTPAHEWADSTAAALHQHVESDTLPATSNPSKVGEHPDAGSAKDFIPETNYAAPKATGLASQPIASSASTPGVELPGAYPHGADTAPLVPEDAATRVKDQAVGVLETARAYLPAQEDVQRAFVNAGETAKHYLPESVASYLPGAQSASLPSSEKLGNQGQSSGGVGALPGTISETSVAKLPEERAQAGVGGVGDLPGSKGDADVVRLPEERAVDGEHKDHTSNVDEPPITTTTNQYAKTSAPTQHEHESTPTQHKPDGIMNSGLVEVPTSLLKSALSPHPSGDPTISPPDAPSASSTNLGVISPSPGPSAASNASMKSNAVGHPTVTGLTPHTDGHVDASNTNLSTAAQSGSAPPTPSGLGGSVLAPAIAGAGMGNVSKSPINPGISVGAKPGADDGIGHHGDALPPVPPKDTPAAKSGHLSGPVKDDDEKMRGTFAKEQPPVGKPAELPSQRNDLGAGRGYSSTADAGHSTPGAHEHTSDKASNSSSSMSAGGTKKPGLMDKLKGEAKVISGKLGKNEEKVEEGKRMMGKV